MEPSKWVQYFPPKTQPHTSFQNGGVRLLLFCLGRGEENVAPMLVGHGGLVGEIKFNI